MPSSSLQFSSEMAREYQRVSSSPNVLMRGPFTPSTAIPPSLNRQNSHTSRQGYTRLSGDATALLSRVASSSSSHKVSPRNTPPSSPSQSPRQDEEIHWEIVRRRLSDDCQDGYVSFPDFDHIQSASGSNDDKGNMDGS